MSMFYDPDEALKKAVEPYLGCFYKAAAALHAAASNPDSLQLQDEYEYAKREDEGAFYERYRGCPSFNPDARLVKTETIFGMAV